MVKEAQISMAIVHYFPIFFSKNDCEIEPVVLHTINCLNSTKKIFEFFFSQMPDAMGVCGTKCKVKKEENLFFGDSQLPSQIARTRVRLL